MTQPDTSTAPRARSGIPRPRALHRHRRRRHVRRRPHHGGPRHCRSAAPTPRTCRSWRTSPRPGPGSPSATTPATWATRRRVVAGSAIRPGQPRARSGPGRRAARAAPLRGTRRHDGAGHRRDRRRHARQVHHDVHDHRAAAGRRAGPVVRHRRQRSGARRQRGQRQLAGSSSPRPTSRTAPS